jgi:hypothetical protein
MQRRLLLGQEAGNFLAAGRELPSQQASSFRFNTIDIEILKGNRCQFRDADSKQVILLA